MIVVGVLVLLAGIGDVCWTALGLMGGGPLSSLIARSTWAVFKGLPLGSRGRVVAGPLILLLLVVTWSLLLWLGWFLVFFGGGGVMRASTGVAASASETIYFTGYCVFTLGNGDYAPTAFPWTLLTSIASGSGLIVITLAITYFIAVLASVVEKRALATLLADLGATPAGIVTAGWNGSNFQPLEQFLPQIATAVGVYAQHHLAYPVLHYFHGETLRVSMPVRIAALHDALLILSEGVAPGARPHPLFVEPIRQSIRSFAAVARGEFVRSAAAPPPPPDLEPLAQKQIPTVTADVFKTASIADSKTRQVLRALVENDTHQWSDLLVKP